VNLAQIRDLARKKADEEATGFVDNDEANSYVNEGVQFIYGKIVQRFELFFCVPGTSLNGGLITIVNNQQAYDLPSTLLKLVRVERRNLNDSNDNNWRKLMRLNIGNDQINDFFPIREGRDQGFGYFISGNKIYLRPVPSAGFDLRMWFIPKAEELVNDTDETTIPSEYHRLIADYAVLQILRKSGEGIWKESAELFQQHLNHLLDTIEYRSQEPEQMTVTDDYDFDRWIGSR
jgi:hypothetical protein